MINFSGTDEHEDIPKTFHQTNSNLNRILLVELPLSRHRTGSNETALVSEISNIINDENVIIAPGQRKSPVSILSVEFFEEQALPYLLTKAKFGYKAPRDIPISPDWYFN